MLWAVVMAGGPGTRLWPLSNPDRPKPLLELFPGEHTLLEETLSRLSPLIPPSRTLLIGNEEHVTLLRKYAPKIPRAQVIGEPASRNTAPTVGLAASMVHEKDPNAVLLVLPADHRIKNKLRFHAAIQRAVKMVKKTGSFSIFGVVPSFASPSYGYVEMGKKISSSVFALKRFVEKPSQQRARKFLRTKRYLWHAGIFLAEANTVLHSIRKYKPKLARGLQEVRVRGGAIYPKSAFRRLPKLSFDYAVLERIKDASLIRCVFDWSDVGTWQSLSEFWKRDLFRNTSFGPVKSLASRGNLLYVNGKPVYLNRVDDLMVIDTPETLFISRKSDAEQFRRVVAAFSEKHPPR